MNWYEKVKRYYDMGKYTVEQMKVFVQTNKITAEEFTKITGQALEELEQ